MKTMSVAKVLLPAIVLAVSVSTFAKNPHKPKKEILHYFAQDQMVSSGIISNASGQVSIHVNSVGKGKPQELQLHIGHLDINATCELQALIDGDTNLIQVAEFTTDGNGNARLEFREKNVGNGHPHGQQSLPAALNPLTRVHQLVVTDTSGQALLTADLTAPVKFVFFLKKDISTSDIHASVQINSESQHARLRLDASGLATDSAYSLALNDVTVTSANSDAHGRVRIGWELQNPADVLSLQSVSLLDSATNTVLQATLP